MKMLLSEIFFTILIASIGLAGLWISNILYDCNVPHYISRKAGHGVAGIAFLIMYLVFKSAWWPLLLTACFSVMLISARFLHPAMFRGVGGSGRDTRTLSEIWFVVIAVVVYLTGWLWLNKPAIATASLLYLAWGDCVTGLVRQKVYNRAVKGLWGSLAMFAVCLVISWFFIKPFWIGITASAAATITEWACGDVGIFKAADDNWAIPVAGLGSMLFLSMIVGVI